jgi:hypothetical protein
MANARVFISHSHEEKDLALAWKHLVEDVSAGVIEAWLSSDQSAGGGMPLGKEWRRTIYEKMRDSTHVLALFSPQSMKRPWILWECGIATGVDLDRLLVPIAHSMPVSELPSPLQSYQAYDGDARDKVTEICERLVTSAGLKANSQFWTKQLELFENRVRTSRPKRAISTSLVELWVERFKDLIQANRGSELPHFVNQFYLSVGEKRAIDSRIHDSLSKALLTAKRAKEALSEVDFGLSLSPDDTILLHRKGLILIELQNYGAVEQLLNEVYTRNAALKDWPELAGLEGRMYRERAAIANDPALYAKAAAAYRRGFDFDATQYYSGGQAIAMASLAGDQVTVDALLPGVIAACQAAANGDRASYWEYFALAEMYLIKGDVAAARATYEAGLARQPAPGARERDSALMGAKRTAQARNLKIPDIEAAFSKKPAAQ